MVRIAFLGVGGVGGWLSARLCEANSAEIVLIARGAHGQAIKEKGLCLRVQAGSSAGASEVLQIPPGSAEVFATIADAIEAGVAPVDFVILGVKSWQVEEAAKEAQRLLTSGGCVVTTQNGVEAPRKVAAAIGSQRVMAGICKVLAMISAPGEIDMKLAPAIFQFGECFDQHGSESTVATSERSQRLEIALKSCKGSNCGIFPSSAWTAVWDKAIFMCSMGPVAALCRAPIDKLCSIPATRSLLKLAMVEIIKCGSAAGYLWDDGRSPEVVADTYIEQLSKSAPGSTPSTLRDVMAGRPSELHELTGGIQRAGRALTIPTPTHDLIYGALLPQELLARGDVQYDLMGVSNAIPHAQL